MFDRAASCTATPPNAAGGEVGSGRRAQWSQPNDHVSVLSTKSGPRPPNTVMPVLSTTAAAPNRGDGGAGDAVGHGEEFVPLAGAGSGAGSGAAAVVVVLAGAGSSVGAPGPAWRTDVGVSSPPMTAKAATPIRATAVATAAASRPRLERRAPGGVVSASPSVMGAVVSGPLSIVLVMVLLLS